MRVGKQTADQLVLLDTGSFLRGVDVIVGLFGAGTLGMAALLALSGQDSAVPLALFSLLPILAAFLIYRYLPVVSTTIDRTTGVVRIEERVRRKVKSFVEVRLKAVTAGVVQKYLDDEGYEISKVALKLNDGRMVPLANGSNVGLRKKERIVAVINQFLYPNNQQAEHGQPPNGND